MVGPEPREGKFGVVEMDPVITDRRETALTAAEVAPPTPVGAMRRGSVELRGLTKRYGEETVVNAVAASSKWSVRYWASPKASKHRGSGTSRQAISASRNARW